MGVPNGSCICDDGLDQGIVSEWKGFFLMAPGRACEGFYDIETFRSFSGDVFDMGANVKRGFKVFPKILEFSSSDMMLLLMDTWG